MTNGNIRLLCLIALLLVGCRGLLPTVKQTTPSPWKSFDEAKAAFDRITPYLTSVEELKEIGFNPFSTSNITILTYLDIMKTLPPVPSEEIDEGILLCIRAKENCRAYEFEPKVVSNKRLGNFWLDIFNFRREISQTGWRFKAFIIVIDGTVVYKLWGGTPSINEKTDIRNPLGPLQDAGDTIFNRMF